VPPTIAAFQSDQKNQFGCQSFGVNGLSTGVLLATKTWTHVTSPLFPAGPPRVERDGEPISIPAAGDRAIGLPGRDAPAHIATPWRLLWPEHDQSARRLRRDLSSLKQALGDEARLWSRCG
jgi:hypothetical protein